MIVFGIPLLTLLALPLGAVAGFAWYRLVGCRTGVCPLTSNPWTSAGLGMALAWFLIK